MTSVVVLQSNYIPWKGYFDLIHDADLFVFYDDVQFTKSDWRNRNKIKTQSGTEWMTIPTGTNEHRLICDVELKDNSWQKKHWRMIQQNYCKCPYFDQYRGFFEEIYVKREWKNLSELNQFIIKRISSEFLQINTQFYDSRDYKLEGQKLDRLLDLLTKVGAKTYISGPSAKNYIEMARFEELGIELRWKDYSGYPEYAQRNPPFEHAVSIIDLLLNTGEDAQRYIWGWRREPGLALE
jgi:hypothetical protein